MSKQKVGLLGIFVFVLGGCVPMQAAAPKRPLARPVVVRQTQEEKALQAAIAASLRDEQPRRRVEEEDKKVMEQVQRLVQAERQKLSDDLNKAKTKYPKNVNQPEIDLQTEGNDCAFRSARNAVIAYLVHSKNKGSIIAVTGMRAMKGDVSIIPGTSVLKQAAKADGSLLFPPYVAGMAGGGDYRTDEKQAQGIINLAIEKYVDKAHQRDAHEHISLIPGMLLGLKDMHSAKSRQADFFYGWTENVLQAIRRLNNPESLNDYHIFIVNADQRPDGRAGVSHWLTIMVHKQNGNFVYTIFDSLNKPRLELQQNLAYLVEEYGKKSRPAQAAARRPVTCPTCTFDNPADAQACAVCERRLP